MVSRAEEKTTLITPPHPEAAKTASGSGGGEKDQGIRKDKFRITGQSPKKGDRRGTLGGG